MECDFLDLQGKCRGPYSGFGCIKEKCTAEHEAKCEFNDQGFYCRKYRRFECIGIVNCGSLDDYMNYVNERRRRAQASK